jgi:integrase
VTRPARFKLSDVRRIIKAAKAGITLASFCRMAQLLKLRPVQGILPKTHGQISMTSVRLKYVQAYIDHGGNPRHYFRKRGRPLVALPGLPGSAEFMSVYQSACSDTIVRTVETKAHGTMAWLIRQFCKSSKFQNLKPSSQRVYRIALDAIEDQHGHRLVREMGRRHVLKIIEDVADKSGPASANLYIAVLSRLLQHAVDVELRKDNPAIRLSRYKLGTRHTWTETELRQYERRWPVGTRQRLAFDVLLYLGQRVSDAAAIKRTPKRVQVTQKKTGAVLSLPIHPSLIASIKACEQSGANLIGSVRDGRPISGAAVSMVLQRALRSAGLPAICKPHGLRKALSRRIAESGGTSKEVQAFTGHASLSEVERYTAAAEQSRLADSALRKLRRRRK